MRFQLYTSCSVGTCDTPRPTVSGYPEYGRTFKEVKALGWRIYQNWGWVCPLHVHICDWGCLDSTCPIVLPGYYHKCGPECYDIVDAGCCEDHPDCVYDDNFHICGESYFDEDCGYLDMGGPDLERVVEGLTDSSDGTFEGETTLTVN